MADWGFYGRDVALAQLEAIVAAPRWFFARIQGRRRIGKTALIFRLAQLDSAVSSRLVYTQIPDSDERDVAAAFRRALEESDASTVRAMATSASTDFASMAKTIGKLCRANFIIVLDEFQYFTRKALHPFNSFLQAEVDALRTTNTGGLFVLGSIQSEMNALLDDSAAPLYGRLTAHLDLDHWDFQDLIGMFRAHDILDPYQWLALWSFFEGVPKFYRDAFEQGLFSMPAESFHAELLRRMFLKSSSPLSEEAETWFLREIRGKAISILHFLAENPGSTNGDLVAALSKADDKIPLGTLIQRLVNNYKMVDGRLPVFSNSASRSKRYYITDNFLQAWLAVAKPAKESARLRPEARAIELAVPRYQTLEGFAFEKLVRNLHIECSKKGKGDFELSEINLGYWNRPRHASRSIEIDLVALSAEQEKVRFGACKRSASAHDSEALKSFEQHIATFLTTREGRKVQGWEMEKALFSPIFNPTARALLTSNGYRCMDLNDYAAMY